MLILTLFASCNSPSSEPNNTNTSSDSSDSNATGAYTEANQAPLGTFPIVYEKEIVTIAFAKQNFITDMETNHATQ
jgi:hypothetical protein